MKKLFIFDLDNTITQPCDKYTDEVLGQWFKALAHLKPYEMSFEDAKKMAHEHYQKYQLSCMGHEDVCADAYFKHTHENIIEAGFVSLLPKCAETKDLLEQLKAQGHQLAVLSHAAKSYCHENLAHMDLGHIFDDEWVFGLDSFGISEAFMKHNIYPFHQLAEKASVAFEDVIVVEDTPLNLKAPYAAGMHTVWVRGNGYFTHGLYDDYQPDYVKEEHPMLTDYLKTLV